MTDQPTTQERCPTCGSSTLTTYSSPPEWRCRDPWHDQIEERCPTCGELEPDWDCPDPWHVEGELGLAESEPIE
jgi:rRNA maturation protein Nop10